MQDDFYVYKEKNLFSECLSTLREIRHQGRMCDIVLKVKHIEIYKRKNDPVRSRNNFYRRSRILHLAAIELFLQQRLVTRKIYNFSHKMEAF